jgi:hypothetical protein
MRLGKTRMTKNRITWFLAVAALLCFAPNASATSATLTLTGVGDGATVGNVYVDPYTATITTGTTTVTNVPVICDDWSNNTYMNETWTATALKATTVSNSTLGTPMFGNNQSLYNEAAWLGSQLIANPTNKTVQTDVSFALWALTYGQNGTYEESPAPLTYLASTFSDGTSDPIYQQTLALLSQAMGEGSFSSAGWTIYDPVPGTSNPSLDGVPQEFLVYTPEPSTLISLALGICGLLMFATWQRRKSAFQLAA